MIRVWTLLVEYCAGLMAAYFTVLQPIAITYNANNFAVPGNAQPLSRSEYKKCLRKCLLMPPTPRKPAWLWLKETKSTNSILKA